MAGGPRTELAQGYVEWRRLGEVFNGPAVVRLRPGLDYEPDLFFIPVGLLSAFGEEFFAGTPGVIIEVVSKGTRLHDLRTKAAAYGQHGVQEYWAEVAQSLRHFPGLRESSRRTLAALARPPRLGTRGLQEVEGLGRQAVRMAGA